MASGGNSGGLASALLAFPAFRLRNCKPDPEVELALLWVERCAESLLHASPQDGVGVPKHIGAELLENGVMLGLVQNGSKSGNTAFEQNTKLPPFWEGGLGP